MKYLNQFLKFDWSGFASGKTFIATGIRVWNDFQTKQQLGWIVDVVITVDKTPYKFKGGEVGNNMYEKLSFKCAAKPTVNVSDVVVPVNPVATIWGEYRNQLSVKADTVVLASSVAAPGKEKN